MKGGIRISIILVDQAGRSLLLVNEVMRRDDEVCIVPETMMAKMYPCNDNSTKGRPGSCTIVDGKRKILQGNIFT